MCSISSSTTGTVLNINAYTQASRVRRICLPIRAQNPQQKRALQVTFEPRIPPKPLAAAGSISLRHLCSALRCDFGPAPRCAPNLILTALRILVPLSLRFAALTRRLRYGTALRALTAFARWLDVLRCVGDRSGCLNRLPPASPIPSSA